MNELTTTVLVMSAAVVAGLALGFGVRWWAPRLRRRAEGGWLWRNRSRLQTAGLTLATIGLVLRYGLAWAISGRVLFLGGLAVFLVGMMLDRAADPPRDNSEPRE